MELKESEAHMRTWKVLSAAFLLALATSPAWGQDEKEAPKGPDSEDDELTPAHAMELLKEAHELMGKAEELLNDSSRGKALETEKDLLAKLEKEFKDDPSALQKQILEKIRKMVEKAEKREKDVVDRLAEIIRKAKS